MTTLVTGGAGYIGSHMVWRLLDAGEDVVVMDRLSTGFDWAVPAEAELVVGDAGDQELVALAQLIVVNLLRPRLTLTNAAVYNSFMTTRTDAPTRREQILSAAARLFAERGFHGVGVDEIGAAVGISGPGLYRHFAGKDAMLAELLVGISERLFNGGRRRLAESARAGLAPEATLDALIDGHIDFALDDRSLITLHDRELDRLRESDRKLVRQLQRQYVELWVGVVGEVWPELPERQARASVHAVFGLLNSTPHLSRPAALPDREEMAVLLHRLARGALASAASAGQPT